jgi:hypothetical protein
MVSYAGVDEMRFLVEFPDAVTDAAVEAWDFV